MSMEFVENIKNDNDKLIKSPNINGENIKKFRDFLTSDGMDEESINRICTNASRAIYFLPDPTNQEKTLSKILCLGKVQSGKTGFFIAATAMAFDNDYEICFLLGGTKTKLRNQNYDRLKDNLGNNTNIDIYELNETSYDEVNESISNGKKVILVCLKNAAANTNLGLMEQFVDYYKDYKTLIVDDEGDEVTPGAPKSKNKGVAHKLIANIINIPKICAFFSVTATPQANLLISTLDDVSPDYIMLVEPGLAYTGGNSFHDTYENPHTIEIDDHDDFETTIPKSFENAFYFFIFGCCLQRAKGNLKEYSMLVHPSSLNLIQQQVQDSIQKFFDSFKTNFINKLSVSYTSALERIQIEYNKYVSENNINITFEQIKNELDDVFKNIDIILVNYKSAPDLDNNPNKYKVYVGGNMLGRGLTIPNLFVTYMYRDNNGKTPIDTLYQRARWFGYKKSFFDICRVYMTRSLKNQFIATVENENDMWNSIRAFLKTGINARKLPRVFTLNDEKLILTRPSISKTITLERINPGYTSDTSVDLDESEKIFNRNLFENFFNNWKEKGFEKNFSNNNTQVHFIIPMKYTDFISEFLSKYKYPLGSNFGTMGFEKIRKMIENGSTEDDITVVVMRYKSKEKRSLMDSVAAIKYLPQSWNEGTAYAGDKFLPDLQNKFHIQIHLVYFDDNLKDDYIPILALNNPITEYQAKYVTGDNYYGD